jgi:DNA ligase (NAD+)
MQNIKQYLDACSEAYYNGSPIIEDSVFDALADTIGYGSVGAKQHENTEKHYFQMYSLQKFYDGEDMKKPLEGIKDVVYSLKLDGAAIDILYIDGQLSRVLTRGDGIEGKVVTDKFLASNFIPKSIKQMGIVQVTGELMAPKHIENARNYAAGSLNLKDTTEFSTRALEFFAYGVQPNIFKTYKEDMKQLRRLGFNTAYGEYELDKTYPCDGMVYRVNDNALFNELGYTAKSPRGAYALKERSEGADTILLDVIWQTSKSGRVTPVAVLQEVVIEDAKITRATLNNVAFIEALDIQIGDMVHVIRAGSIIPCITHKVEG